MSPVMCPSRGRGVLTHANRGPYSRPTRRAAKTLEMNSTKVQNPRREMQVALLAEPKTPPGVEHVYIIL